MLSPISYQRLAMIISTRFFGLSGVLLPKAMTPMRVLLTPLSIKNERIESARDKESRRALLADKPSASA